MSASPESRPEAVRTFRAASGAVSFVLCSALGVFLLSDAVVRGGWVSALLLAPWVLLGLWVVYVIAFVSFIRIDANGAVVQNLLRRTSFGWKRVRDIDLRWQLVFALEDGRDLTCYGGPARARPRRLSGDSDAKAPAGFRDLAEIRDKWEKADETADAEIKREWDLVALLALCLIGVAAALSIFFANV